MTREKLGTIGLHFKEDIAAAFGLALVVLPIALGISIASEVPPMAGVIAAVVGGVVATFFRGSHVTINGPSAGLIAVMLSGMAVLTDEDLMLGFQYLLAAIVVAGVIQMLLGIFRFGQIGDIVPTASINGMLAAVGLIILGTQIHVALGVHITHGNTFQNIKAIPHSIQNLHPIITATTIIAIIVLFLHNKINHVAAQFISAPIWIILFTIPIIYHFNFLEVHYVHLFGKALEVGPKYLVQLPEDITNCIIHPDFGKIDRVEFWVIALTIAAVSSIETLVSAKAVDKLDSLRRETNLNKELFAVGLSSVVSGAIGGLPIITAIPVYNGAKTKWSNLYYGVFLLVLLLVFAPLIKYIPMSVLAVLLVFTGYKLAGPKIWVDTYRKGDDQFLIFLTTLMAALGQGLLAGVLVGIATTMFVHFVKSNLERKQFFDYLMEPVIETKRIENTHELYIQLKGIVNFINIPKLKKMLRDASKERHIIVDMSNARLVDYTVLEYLHEDALRYDIPNVQLEIVGLETHDASSRHPNATRILPDNKKPQLSQHQQALEVLAQQNNGTFWPEIRWDFNQFKNFYFFKTRAIEYGFNTAKGNYKMFFEWETCDIKFEEARLFANQERHTSVMVLHLPFNAPVFVLQKEALLDKIGVKLALQAEDINFYDRPNFSSIFLLQGPNPEDIRNFFSDSVIDYLEQHPYYHIESNGSMLLIFKEMRFSTPSAMARMHEFSHELAEILLESWKAQPLDLEALL